jgi:hypothetical protein
MSYDFILLRREPGQSWDEVLEANERRVVAKAGRPFGPFARARAERIADRLQAHDPQLERFTSEHYIELTRPDGPGVQVSLFERELGVTVAYWHTGRAAQAVMGLVWSYLGILEQETGWETYDPQLGRSLDRARDLDAVSGMHADMSARLSVMFSAHQAEPDSPDQPG